METNRLSNGENSWKYWITTGLVWGIFMFIIINLIFPFFTGGQIVWKNTLISLPLWIVSGLGFGVIMKFYKNHLNTK